MADEDENKSAKELVRVGLEHLRKSGAWNPSEFGLMDVAPSNPANKIKSEDADATLWERLTPAERLELYNSKPEEFQRILKAKEDAGYRALTNGPGNVRRY